MLDTVGPELQVFNKSEKPIALEADALVTISSDTSLDASSEILPINYADFASVGVLIPQIVCSSLWFFSGVEQHLRDFFSHRLLNQGIPFLLVNICSLEVRPLQFGLRFGYLTPSIQIMLLFCNLSHLVPYALQSSDNLLYSR